MGFNSSHVVNLTGVITSETISDSEYSLILSQIQGWLGNNFSIFVLTTINNSFINVSYSTQERVLGVSYLLRKWYCQVYVNNSFGGNVSNATVSVYNSSGDLIENLFTNSSGWTEKESLIEYINNGTKNYYSDYTLNITISTYDPYNKTFNFTNNTIDYFTLTDNAPPLVTIISPIATTYITSSVLFNFNLNENGACLFSVDSGVTNYTMDSSDNLNFNYTKQLTDRGYVSNFYCNDILGNRNDTTAVSFNVNVPAEESPSSGGGFQLFDLTDSHLNQGTSKILYKNWGVSFKLGNITHTIKVDEVNGNNIKITASSTPQEATLNLAEEKKFSLTNSSYYDILVELNSIKGSGANLTIKGIHEETSSGNNNIALNNTRVLNSSNGAETGNQNNNQNNEPVISSLPWFVIVPILLVMVFALFVLFKLVNKKHKKR